MRTQTGISEQLFAPTHNPNRASNTRFSISQMNLTHVVSVLHQLINYLISMMRIYSCPYRSYIATSGIHAELEGQPSVLTE